MFLTPYQTTACSATAGLPAIASALQRAAVHEDLPPAVTLKENVLEGVFLVPPYLKEIKPFSLPIEFDGPNGLAVAVDVRGITKQVGDRQLKIVAGGEYEGAVLRAALTKAWIEGGSKEMRRWNDISARVFIRLLSEALVRRLSLGPAEQQAIAAVCGLFYFSNFVDGDVDAEEKERIAVAVSRITRISVQSIMRFYEGDVPQAHSLDGFCNALRHVVQNPRLERVDAAFIITLMGGVWFGGQARMVVAVALEYPPVWLALIYQALTDRSFHGASLTKMVETENRGNAGAQFIRDVGSYLDL